MEIIEELIILNKEYEDKLYNIFKREIDNAIKYAEGNKMNSIDKFIYINETLDKLHNKLGIARKSIVKEEKRDNYIEPSLTDDFIKRIDIYIEPITKEVQNYLKIMGEIIIQSDSLYFLIETYKELDKILNHPIIKNNMYVIERIDLDKNKFHFLEEIDVYKKLLIKENNNFSLITQDIGGKRL